jgi:hypothetical protein
LPDETVPAVILDITAEEADKLLATIDPLSALAGQDDEALIELLATIDSENADVQKMLADLVDLEPTLPEPVAIPESFELLVTCTGEKQLAELLGELMKRGFNVRSLIS